jgi:hypothetical protein
MTGSIFIRQRQSSKPPEDWQAVAIALEYCRRSGSGDFGLPISYRWFRLLLPSAGGLEYGWLDRSHWPQASAHGCGAARILEQGGNE